MAPCWAATSARSRCGPPSLPIATSARRCGPSSCETLSMLESELSTRFGTPACNHHTAIDARLKRQAAPSAQKRGSPEVARGRLTAGSQFRATLTKRGQSSGSQHPPSGQDFGFGWRTYLRHRANSLPELTLPVDTPEWGDASGGPALPISYVGREVGSLTPRTLDASPDGRSHCSALYDLWEAPFPENGGTRKRKDVRK